MVVVASISSHFAIFIYDRLYLHLSDATSSFLISLILTDLGEVCNEDSRNFTMFLVKRTNYVSSKVLVRSIFFIMSYVFDRLTAKPSLNRDWWTNLAMTLVGDLVYVTTTLQIWISLNERFDNVDYSRIFLQHTYFNKKKILWVEYT